ncbi:MAG: hypothetical protein WB421_17325, partial [Terriglobales bacterium]
SIALSQETLPEICPFTDRTNVTPITPSLVLGPVPVLVPSYRTRAPILSLQWQDFSLGPDVIEYELYTPFEGAVPNIRAINKMSKQPLRMHIFTPPFCTNFPHLTVDSSLITNPDTTVDLMKRQGKYLDLSMFGAGMIQAEFRAWMDKFDDSLLVFMYENQRLLGKMNQSCDAIKALQRRMFCPRISSKTGKRYEDSMLAKCKAFAFRSGRPVIATATENIIPVVDENDKRINPTDIQFHDMVVCSLRYDGCYAKTGLGFGHQWVLLGVKCYGKVLEAPVIYESFANDENVKSAVDPTSDPLFVYPEITDTNDFPHNIR